MRRFGFIIVAIFLLLTSFSIISFVPKDDIIIWSNDTKLAWDDFKQKAPATTTLGASTDSGIELNTISTDPEIKISIKSIFNKNKSWVKTKTDHLLKHEQLHFDITELFARKMRKVFKEKKFDSKTMKSEMTTTYKQEVAKLDAFQSKYDKETNHSRVLDKQTQWESDILKDLQGMESYKDTTVVLTVK